MCQLVNVSLTHCATSLPAGYPMGVFATREVISFMRCSSLLRCKCTNQVNLFSHPLYSLNSIPCLTFPHERGSLKQPASSLKTPVSPTHARQHPSLPGNRNLSRSEPYLHR